MQFDELLAHPTFWEQIWFDEKIRDRDLPEPVKLHQPHLISGTVALADITEQTRVYHYTSNFYTTKIRKVIRGGMSASWTNWFYRQCIPISD